MSAMRKQIQFTLGAIFFALLIVYGGTRFYRSLGMMTMESDPGWTVRVSGAESRVGQLRSAEAAGVLRSGDEVLAVNGQQINRVSDLVEMFHDIEPGRP